MSRLQGMDTTHDVIIVGARCAGSATALQLARRGLRVLVVDRATFGSESTPPTGNVIPQGLWHLRRWGLLDRIQATTAPPVTSVIQHIGDASFENPVGSFDGIDEMRVLRHSVLDAIVAEAAMESGAEIRFRTRVTGLRQDGARVTGIEGTSANGDPFTATAPVVVGADGKYSSVARAVGAQTYRERAAGSFGFFTYYTDLDCSSIEVWMSPTRQLIFFPSHGGETWVALVQPASETATFKADPPAAASAHLAHFPDAQERLAAATRVATLHSTGGLNGFFRESAGRGWALVGDAGFTKDPGPGRGITDAFFHSELLCDAIVSGLGDGGIDDALAAYADERDAASVDVYDATQDVAEWSQCASFDEVGARFAALGAAQEREGARMLNRVAALSR